jgi:hypothetical protein
VCHDFGLDNGRFYIASELAQGESLRERILRGPVPVRELYRIAVQLAGGMAAAHAASINPKFPQIPGLCPERGGDRSPPRRK